MHFFYRSLVLAGAFLLTGSAAFASDPSPADLLEQAKTLYMQRTDSKAAKQASESFLAVTKADPGNYEAWWRLARNYWWLSDHCPKKQCLPLLEKGKAAAEQAIKINPKRKEGHYWCGVCIGRIGEEKGILNSLFLVDPLAKEMEAVLAADPKDGPALYILAQLYRQAPGWPLSRGDIQKSLSCARQAVANRPDQVMTHLGLAETLIDLGRKEEAKKELLLALELPGPEDEQPETAMDKKDVRKLLNKLN